MSPDATLVVAPPPPASPAPHDAPLHCVAHAQLAPLPPPAAYAPPGGPSQPWPPPPCARFPAAWPLSFPQVVGGDVLEPLRRLWCKVTLQSRLVLELQTIDSQACIGKNRGSRLSKSEGLGHLLVQVFCQKKGMH